MKAKIIIDYLTISVQGDYNPRTPEGFGNIEDFIRTELGLDPLLFEDVLRGFNFYKKTLRYGNIRVFYDGTEKMGICVNLSGQGIQELETHTNTSILDFLKRINKNPAIKTTRIDIACDDFDELLCFDEIMQHVSNGNFRTRLLNRNQHESFRGKTSEGARSIYFGSSTSLYRIRIYDKARQMSNGENVDWHWTRFEIVLKDTYAVQAVKLLASSNNENLGNIVAGIINDKFAFIKQDDSNISRCSYADFWKTFLGEIQEIKLTSKQKAEHSIDKHRKWLRVSCGRVMAKVIEAVGGEDEFNKDIAKSKYLLTDADLKMIEDYKAKMLHENKST
jgi:DNA relaxase NicK